MLYSVITFIYHQNLIIVYECHVSRAAQLATLVSMTTQFSHILSFFIEYYNTVVFMVCYGDLSFAIRSNLSWAF